MHDVPDPNAAAILAPATSRRRRLVAWLTEADRSKARIGALVGHQLEDIAEELGTELYINPEEPLFEEALEMMFRFMG